MMSTATDRVCAGRGQLSRLSQTRRRACAAGGGHCATARVRRQFSYPRRRRQRSGAVSPLSERGVSDCDMEIDEHIAIVRREGERLADVAGQTSFDADVGTCPGWTIRDLVRHVGGIHSWATAHVSKSRSGRFDPFEEMEGRWPSDDALLEWFRAGHHKLVSALESAPDDLECFTFLKAPSARAFWARRQAHETGMHRADAESAGAGITPFAPEQAVDGIDELLFGFMARPGQQLRTEEARVVQLSATDAAAAWQVRTSQGEPAVRRGLDGEADLRVRATASDLFLLVWNRRAQDGLDVVGDTSLLDVWRQSVFVRWR